MPVTTVKLSEELKRRVVRLVARTGTSVHAFMLHAVEQALAAREAFAHTGKGHSMETVADYARARARGESARRPRSRRWP